MKNITKMKQIAIFVLMLSLLIVPSLYAAKNNSAEIKGFYDVPKLITNIENIENIVINDTNHSVFDKESDDLFYQFMGALAQSTKIKSLTFNGSVLSGSRHTALSNTLSGQSMQGLESFSLISNSTTANETIGILNALKSHPTLHSLTINKNKITSFLSDNMDEFAKILKELPNLKSLNLSDTGLSEDDFRDILFDDTISIATNIDIEHIPGPLFALEHLNLSNNPLGYDGLNYIILNLDEMPSLKTLRLENILQVKTVSTNKTKDLIDNNINIIRQTNIETIYLGTTSETLAKHIELAFRSHAPKFNKVDYTRADSFTSYADSAVEAATGAISSYWNSWFGSSDADTKKQEEEKEQAAIEQAARELAAREQAAREQAAIELAAREQAAREQAAIELAAREQAAREQAAREQAARELAAREQAAREQAAREQAAREQAAKEQAEDNIPPPPSYPAPSIEDAIKAEREQAARELAARELAAREQHSSDRSSLLDQIKAGTELRSSSAQKKELTEEQEYVRTLIIGYTDMYKDELEEEKEYVGNRTAKMIRKVIVNSLIIGYTPKEIQGQNRALIGMNSLELEKFSFLSFANAENGMEKGHEKEGLTLLQLYIQKKVLELILEKYDVKTEAKQQSGKNDYYIQQLLDIVEQKQRMVNDNEETILDSSQLILDSLEIIKVLTRLYTTGLPDTITSIMSGNNAEDNIIKLILDDKDPFPFLKEKESIKLLVSGNTYINISSALFKFWKLNKRITAASGSEASLMAKELGNGRTDWDKLNDWVAEAGKIFSTAEVRNLKNKLTKVESTAHAEKYVAQVMRDMKSAAKDIRKSNNMKDTLNQALIKANEDHEFAVEFDRNNPNVDLRQVQQSAQGGANAAMLETMMKNIK